MFIDSMQPIIELTYKQMLVEQENQVLRTLVDLGIRVDKERLIKALQDAKSFYDEGYEAGKNHAVVTYKWVSVKDRLPKDNGVFLVLYENSNIVDKNFYADEPWRFTLQTSYGRVTHWMPLPEPPKDDSNG